MQLLGNISTCGATAGVFARPRPTADIGQIEIPQRNSAVLSFTSEAREALAVKRRDFITLLGSTAAWSFAAQAQQYERLRRIVVLMAVPENDREYQAFLAAFREGLQKLGWAEGRNIRIVTRFATPDVAAMQGFAKELVTLQP